MHRLAHSSKGRRNKSRSVLASQFSLNPYHTKGARTRAVHETFSTNARDVWYYSSRKLEPLHLQACGSSNDPHLGRAGTWHVPRWQWCSAWNLSLSAVEVLGCRLGSRRLMGSRKSQLTFGGEKFSRYPSGVLSI
jgi:hypothetical protein